MSVFARMRPPRPGATDRLWTIPPPPPPPTGAAVGTAGSGGGKGRRRRRPLPTDLEFTVPRNPGHGHVNNLPQRFCFHFDGVFDEFARQETVYRAAARNIVKGALQGYNGTIFAYGQTGSGKTYTITGGTPYKERGLMPRTIETVFNAVDKAKTTGSVTFKVRLSYIEVYNECIYDLLDKYESARVLSHRVVSPILCMTPGVVAVSMLACPLLPSPRDHADVPLEQWSKIHMFDGRDGQLHLKNLKVYEVDTAKAALQLLFRGNLNRVTSSTPMNMASSRSHCILTLTIENRDRDSAVVRRSKLHMVRAATGCGSRVSVCRLQSRGTKRRDREHVCCGGGGGGGGGAQVDLAGSERVYKTADASALTRHEGRNINLSLHYLEHVILSLRERSVAKHRTVHVPYRNSVLTSVLRDRFETVEWTSLVGG